MIARILTERARRVASERRAWAAEVTVEARGDMSREDFGGLVGISETRVRDCETVDKEPRLQLDKLAGLTEEQRALICRALMGPEWAVAKLAVDAEDRGAAEMLKEAHEAVQAKLAGNDDHALSRECMEAATVFLAQAIRAAKRADAARAGNVRSLRPKVAGGGA
jgi:hypothetical protein